jgi:ATP-dependent Clp protease ATP-binding subunit ClpA
MKRAIQDKVEDFLSEEVLLGKLKENTQYVLKVEEETVKITKGK